MDQAPLAASQPGTYALLLRLDLEESIPVGRRWLPLTPGWALYLGSAFGPGGIAGRLRHHRRPAARPHWHIDYLRQHAALEAVWFSYDPIRRECLWAEAAQALGGRAPPFRFGASDCRCRAHLYFFKIHPTFTEFVAALRIRAPDHANVFESG
ncbi:MAG: GIY-YIG nuclease family protein [Candidatus Competibacter sp.]